jgi:hypothetical protein
MDILVVSEDPNFITAVHDVVQPKGGRVNGCLGPANSHCPLETKHVCPMAEHAEIVVVDSPPSGYFGSHGDLVPSGDYAARLQRAHPGRLVLLCGAIPGVSGASGDVDHVTDRVKTLATIEALLEARV